MVDQKDVSLVYRSRGGVSNSRSRGCIVTLVCSEGGLRRCVTTGYVKSGLMGELIVWCCVRGRVEKVCHWYTDREGVLLPSFAKSHGRLGLVRMSLQWLLLWLLRLLLELLLLELLL